MSPDFPKIRAVQPIPYQNGSNPSVLLRDPLQLRDEHLLIPRELTPLLALCDGTRDHASICRIFTQHFRIRIGIEDLQQVLQAFDEMLLLENQRASEAIARALEAYRLADHRMPASAGGSYPSDPDQLRNFLSEQLQRVAPVKPTRSVRGVLTPHIDFFRGSETYAGLWKSASPWLSKVDLIVMIGTDHYGTGDEITLTKQHYATPFGVLPTNLELVEAIADLAGPQRVFAGELYHKTEHSLELPLIWLHHFLHKEVEILPVLCGPLVPGSRVPAILAQVLARAARTRRVFTVISGDLAHRGPAFGEEPLTQEDRAAIQRDDRGLCEHLRKGNADAFLADILETGNENNVCGAYPLYLGLKAAGLVGGTETGYQVCPADDEDTSIVSIAGMLFH